MIKNWRTTLACLLVFIFGLTLFYVGTDGFQAYTAETARLHKLNQDQPQFPEVLLQDSFGREYSMAEFEDKYVFITFIYTACYTVCVELEQNMAQVYDLIPEKYIEEDIYFLTISFDPERDDPETLNKYKDYFDADGETWRMARIEDEAQLNQLLNTFGVIVIPDGKGHFGHNSAFYLVNTEGQLIEVMDYTKIEEAAHNVIDILEKEKEV